ncbi:MAG: DoxX family protein, partial [Brooklawnia sp.]|uniref:DoxX family protein n=1 Tax=Brooklawnia sp. TaxID=2699740 RepID=UPI003C779FE8
AEATRRAAEKTRAELEAARAEAKAKAEAAALQVRLEQEEIDRQAAVARVQQRALRDEQLGVRTVEVSEPEVITVTRRSTDQPLGALALLLVRLTVAGWIGILGWQVLVDRQAVTDVLTDVGIPSAMTSWMSWSAGIAMFAVALFLLFGVATRAFAGILAAFLVAFLALFRFGPFSPFLEGQFGFYGDREVFITVLCLVLVLLGAGGWSADARIRRRRKAVHRQD